MLTQTIDYPPLGAVNVEFKKGSYGNDRLALILNDFDSGEPFCVLTVNIPEAELEEGEFIVKSYSENEPIAKVLRNSTHFMDTGRRIKTGFVSAEIWRFRNSDIINHIAVADARRR